MQEVSQAYKDLMQNPILPNPYQMYCLLEVINQEAQEQAQLNDIDVEYYAQKAKDPFVLQKVTKPYATCEKNLCKVDESTYFLPKPNEALYFEQGVVGGFLSDEACVIKQSFQITFENALTFEVKGLNIHFAHTYPISFSICDGDGTFLKQYTNNSSIFKTNDVFVFHKGMQIMIHKLKMPHTRCRLLYIEFGMYVELTNDSIVSMQYHQQIHPLSTTCYISDMNITCLNQEGEYDTENPSSIINFLERLQDIKVQLSLPLGQGKNENIPLAHLYLNEWSSNQKEACFKAVDIFNFLESTYYQTHYESNKNVFDLCEEILMDAGIENYNIASSLKHILIKNPIPKGSHKECLQLLCNASQCIFYQDRLGRITIEPTSQRVKTGEISKEDMIETIAVGTKLEQIKQLEVLYTTYNLQDGMEQICKNTYENGEVFIEFNEPVKDVQVEGSANATVLASGPYFALLKVISAGDVIVSGRKYVEAKQRCIYTLNERGVIKQIDNPLISNKQMADAHAKWIKPYLLSDRAYEMTIRGRMEYDVMDVLALENAFNKNLQIQLEDYTLSFSGSLESNVKGRKVAV